jgi:hypothetical protein
MGGNKNTNTSAVNGSRPTDDATKHSNDMNTIQNESYVTIRINKSHLFGAGCALFGALLVIGVQKFMGVGGPYPSQDQFHSTQFHQTTSTSVSLEHAPNSHPTEMPETHGHEYSHAQDSSEYNITPRNGRHPVSTSI